MHILRTCPKERGPIMLPKKKFLIQVWHSESTRRVADATEPSVETREGEGFVVKII